MTERSDDAAAKKARDVVAGVFRDYPDQNCPVKRWEFVIEEALLAAQEPIHSKDLHELAIKASVKFNTDFVGSVSNKFYLGFKEGYRAAEKK